jgi:hypothetical protein
MHGPTRASESESLARVARGIAGRRWSREGGGRKSAAAATEAGRCCCRRDEAERCRGGKPLLPGSGTCVRRVCHLSPSPSEEPPGGQGSTGRHRRLLASKVGWGALRVGPCHRDWCVTPESESHGRRGALVHIHFHPVTPSGKAPAVGWCVGCAYCRGWAELQRPTLLARSGGGGGRSAGRGPQAVMHALS